MAIIHFFYNNIQAHILQRNYLKSFIQDLFVKEKRQLQSLNYIFCTDTFILGINKTYLDHDYFTDVITFHLSNKDQPIIAEIYISVDRVRENAKALGVSYKKEIHRVIIHGALHLCGYNDKSKAEQIEMRKLEDAYLILYFK